MTYLQVLIVVTALHCVCTHTKQNMRRDVMINLPTHCTP